MKKVFTILIGILSLSNISYSQDFQLIKDTGQKLNDLPIMEVVTDTSTLYKITEKAVNTTFMKEAVQLYHFAQNYLINTGQLENREPAYLAITKNTGGFAKQGFYLRKGTELLNKEKAPYIDLTENYITGKLDKISSLTQLYPHELAHAIYRMLSQRDTTEHQSNAVSMHYFSLITDYSVAFNEGFAEHVENVSRYFEQNDSIKAGIEKTTEGMKPFVLRSARAFKRDFQWPLRLDFYKETMIVWYQKFEDYMRFEHAMHDQATYKNATPDLRNPEDMITIRNCGIEQSKVKRNKPQLMASEGFVSTFFTHLFQTDLPNKYEDNKFYRSFLKDTTRELSDPWKIFSPVQNLFLKYFYIMNKHMNVEYSDSAQLIDFITGFQTEFPDEAGIILKTYKELSGEKFDPALPEQVWYMVKNHDHRILALDALGAITLPVYTFDLNQAEPEDLLTVKGLSRSEAGKIVNYRKTNGFYENYEDIAKIPGIEENTVTLLNNSKFDDDYFRSINDSDLSIQDLIAKPVIHLLERAGIYFLLICLIMYFGFLRNYTISAGKLTLTFIKYIFFLILFILAGLASVVIQGNPLVIFLPFLAIFLLTGYLILRKKNIVLLRFLAAGGLIGILTLYSLI